MLIPLLLLKARLPMVQPTHSTNSPSRPSSRWVRLTLSSHRDYIQAVEELSGQVGSVIVTFFTHSVWLWFHNILKSQLCTFGTPQFHTITVQCDVTLLWEDVIVTLQ